MTPDEEDFAEWYAAVKDDCYRAVLVTMPNADSPADLLAESFARAYANWPSVRTHPAPRAWVLRTALNLHRDMWRRRSRPRLLREASDVSYDDPPIDPMLVRAMARLSERQRQVLVLRVILGLSTRQVAAELGVEPSTVPVHLRRALAALRSAQEIKEYMHENV